MYFICTVHRKTFTSTLIYISSASRMQLLVRLLPGLPLPSTLSLPSLLQLLSPSLPPGLSLPSLPLPTGLLLPNHHYQVPREEGAELLQVTVFVPAALV